MACRETQECELMITEANGKINTKCFWCGIVECSDCKNWMGMGYNEEYDSYFCKGCDNWLEDGCDNPNCAFCKCRPNTAEGLPDMHMEGLE
jgi:hypothetical protein